MRLEASTLSLQVRFPSELHLHELALLVRWVVAAMAFRASGYLDPKDRVAARRALA